MPERGADRRKNVRELRGASGALRLPLLTKAERRARPS